MCLATAYVTNNPVKSSFGLNGLFKSSMSTPLKLNLNILVNILSADSIKLKVINPIINPAKFSDDNFKTSPTNTV